MDVSEAWRGLLRAYRRRERIEQDRRMEWRSAIFSTGYNETIDVPCVDVTNQPTTDNDERTAL